MKRKDILEFLKESARTGEEIAVFLIGGSLARLPGVGAGMEAVRSLRNERWRKQPTIERERMERKRIRRIMQALRMDGLVKSEKIGKLARYELTKNGEMWLDKSDEVGLPTALKIRKFTSELAEVVTIVAYDIPNKRRAYRDWLRQQLIELGFDMLQRSIFIGKVKVPEKLIEDLEQHHILDFVEIFEITKRGTLRVPKSKSNR